MGFDEFLQNAWQKHGDEPEAVAKKIVPSLEIMERPEHISQLIQLATHIFSDHICDVEQAIQTLSKIKTQNKVSFVPEAEGALSRSLAAFSIIKGDDVTLGDFNDSAKIRIYCIVASNFVTLKKADQAIEFLIQADFLSNGLAQIEDPGFRALAVTGNNIATTLEQKQPLTEFETKLMLFAAELGRKHWEKAGTWLQVERAEYRWARSLIAAERVDQALTHGLECLKITESNGQVPLEVFFALELLVDIYGLLDNEQEQLKCAERALQVYENIHKDEKNWCTAAFEKIQGLLND